VYHLTIINSRYRPNCERTWWIDYKSLGSSGLGGDGYDAHVGEYKYHEELLPLEPACRGGPMDGEQAHSFISGIFSVC